MRSMMSTRILTFSFLFFAIPLLLPTNSFISKAQGQTIVSQLEGTEWEGEHSEIYSARLGETITRTHPKTFFKVMRAQAI